MRKILRGPWRPRYSCFVEIRRQPTKNKGIVFGASRRVIDVKKTHALFEDLEFLSPAKRLLQALLRGRSQIQRRKRYMKSALGSNVHMPPFLDKKGRQLTGKA